MTRVRNALGTLVALAVLLVGASLLPKVHFGSDNYLYLQVRWQMGMPVEQIDITYLASGVVVGPFHPPAIHSPIAYEGKWELRQVYDGSEVRLHVESQAWGLISCEIQINGVPRSKIVGHGPTEVNCVHPLR